MLPVQNYSGCDLKSKASQVFYTSTMKMYLNYQVSDFWILGRTSLLLLFNDPMGHFSPPSPKLCIQKRLF